MARVPALARLGLHHRDHVSTDAGARWAALGEAGRYLAVATGPAGTLVLDDAGTVWRLDPAGTLAALTAAPGAHALAASHDGRHAVVVGQGGVLTRSDDGGRSWRGLAPDPALALHAAWLGRDGTLVAVGAAGLVVRDDGGGLEVARPTHAALHALHLDGTGAGLAAGDDGVLLVTDDEGATWERLDDPDATGGRAVRGLDQIDARGHF